MKMDVIDNYLIRKNYLDPPSRPVTAGSIDQLYPSNRGVLRLRGGEGGKKNPKQNFPQNYPLNSSNTSSFNNSRQLNTSRSQNSTDDKTANLSISKRGGGDLYICTHNVRTLHDNNRLDEYIEATKKIKWNVIGLAEIRRNYEYIGIYKKEHLLCHTKATAGCRGVGFLVHKDLINSVKEFKPISDRLAVLIIKTKKFELGLLQVHALCMEG